MGNAYSFGAKMGIVRPRYPVIVTTEHVGNDAKDHFARARSAAGGRRYRTYPGGPDDEVRAVQYIEGLENLRAGVEGIVAQIHRTDATQILAEVLPHAIPSASAILNGIDSRTG